MTTSLALSASWHLLVLAVLALAVHPFSLPDQTAPIAVQLVPPLPVDRPAEPQPPPPRPEARLIPPRVQAAPQAPAPPVPVPPAPAPQAPPAEPAPQVQLRAPDAPPRPIELQTAPAPSTASITRQTPTLVIPAPPQPLAPPAPAKPAERPAPPTPAPTLQAPIAAPAPVQVLTNDRVAPAPVAIVPPQRAPGAGQRTDTPVPSGQKPPAGGGPGGAATPGGAGVFAGPINGGFVAPGGMHMRLGCANPETYHLSAEDKAACLQRFGAQAQGAPELAVNIPAGKRSDYDHNAACRAAVREAAIPQSSGASNGTSVAGLGDNPTLRQCGPGDR